MSASATKQVSLCILRNRARILLYLRDDRTDISYPNHWALLGGQIEEGETPLGALEREIQEEIGCRAERIAFVGRLEVANNPMCEDHTIFLFKGEIREPLDQMCLTEGQRLGYFTLEEFRALPFPEFLREFVLEEVVT